MLQDIFNIIHEKDLNVWRVYYCVNSVRIWSFSCQYFPSFGLNLERYKVSLRIQFECGKIRTRKAWKMDIFHSVFITWINVSSHKNQALIIIQEKTCPNFLKRDSIRVSSEAYFEPGRRFAMEYFRENSKRNPLLMNY